MSGVNTNPLNRRWRSGSDVTSSANDVSSGSTTFTVASYNILGDGAIGRNKNYRYVPEHLRFMPSRHPRIMREIEALDPDVVCMQEVQELHYHKVGRQGADRNIYYKIVFHNYQNTALMRLPKWWQFKLK